jgi:hypothetical protein
MNRQTAAWGLTAAVALICSSCVSESVPAPSPSPGFPTAVLTPSPSPSGPRLTGTISVTGVVQLTSTFSASAAIDVAGTQTPARAGSTCPEYAKGFDQSAQDGGGKGFDAPKVQSAIVNHHGVYVSVSMATGYAGPGTYDSRRNSSLGGYASQDVDNASGVETTAFTSSIHGLTTLTVNPDGSGSLNLTDWGSTEEHGAAGAGGASINASVTWVCQQ